MVETFFNSTGGRIEGKYNASPNKNKTNNCFDHSLQEIIVVYEIHSQLMNHDFSVLRINFRGVGKSQDTFDHGIGELIDATVALEERHGIGAEYWVTGFSFGSWSLLL